MPIDHFRRLQHAKPWTWPYRRGGCGIKENAPDLHNLIEHSEHTSKKWIEVETDNSHLKSTNSHSANWICPAHSSYSINVCCWMDWMNEWVPKNEAHSRMSKWKKPHRPKGSSVLSVFCHRISAPWEQGPCLSCPLLYSLHVAQCLAQRKVPVNMNGLNKYMDGWVDGTNNGNYFQMVVGFGTQHLVHSRYTLNVPQKNFKILMTTFLVRKGKEKESIFIRVWLKSSWSDRKEMFKKKQPGYLLEVGLTTHNPTHLPCGALGSLSHLCLHSFLPNYIFLWTLRGFQSQLHTLHTELIVMKILH